MFAIFTLVNGKVVEGGRVELGEAEIAEYVKSVKKSVFVEVQDVLKVRDLRDRLYKEICTRAGRAGRHFTSTDVRETDYIFKFIKEKNGKYVAVRVTKKQLLATPANEYVLHSVIALLWRDPHKRIREMTLGTSSLVDPLVATGAAIHNAYIGKCSVLDSIDPSFTAVNTDFVKLPIFTYSLQEANQLKQYRRRQNGLPGSFKSKATEYTFRKIRVDLDKIIDEHTAGLIEEVNDEEEEKLVVKIVPKAKRRAPLGKFRCHVKGCHFSSKSTVAVKQHMTVHTGDKPFKCFKCDKSFGIKSNMNRHKKTCKAIRGYSPSNVPLKTLMHHRSVSSGPKPSTSTYTSTSTPTPNSVSLKRTSQTVQGSLSFKPKKLLLGSTNSANGDDESPKLVAKLSEELEVVKKEKDVSLKLVAKLSEELEVVKKEKDVSLKLVAKLSEELEVVKKEKDVSLKLVAKLSEELEVVKKEKDVSLKLVAKLSEELEVVKKERTKLKKERAVALYNLWKFKQGVSSPLGNLTNQPKHFM